jgi:hypothetical protein
LLKLLRFDKIVEIEVPEDDQILDDLLLVESMDFPIESLLTFFEFILIELSSSFEDFVGNLFSIVENFLNDEKKSKNSKLNILNISVKYIQDLDDSLLNDFKISKLISQNFKSQFTKDNWDQQFDEILNECRGNETKIQTLRDVIEISGNSKAPEFLLKLLNVSFEGKFYPLTVDICLKKFENDETLQNDLFFKFMKMEEFHFAFDLSTSSNSKKIQLLCLNAMKVNENIPFELETIERLIQKNYSLKIANLNSSSFNKISKLHLNPKIQNKFISDLILKDDYLHAFDFISKNIFGLSDLLVDFESGKILTEKYFSKQKGSEKVLKKLNKI